MKIAKKMLAVVMALAMVACFAVAAFAASVNCSVGDYNTEKGRAKVTVVFADCVGLKSGDLKFYYDASKVSKITCTPGADAENTAKLGNAFSSEFNAAESTDGDKTVAKMGFYFKENLWATSEWDDAADDLEVDAKVNGENFEAQSFTFTGEQGTSIKAVATYVFDGGEKVVESTFTLGSVAVVEPTTKAPEATTKAPEATTKAPEATTKAPEATTKAPEATTKAPEATTKAPEVTTKAPEATTTKPASKDPVKTDGGMKTGDNGVLAVVAGVFALAGAALVVTKKRK